jgi:glutaredoxin
MFRKLNFKGGYQMITLYSTHCPRCKVLETKLNQKGIEFKIVENIEEMEKLGIQSVPMLKIDDNIMNFTEAIAWINNQ